MHDQFKNLLDRYKAGTATEEDVAFLESWYAEYQPEGAEYDPAYQVMDAKAVWDGLQTVQPVAKHVSLWPRIAAAASLLIMLSVGAYFLLHKTGPPLPGTNLSAHNHATLALPDGRHIALADIQNGALTAGIQKVNNNELVYNQNKYDNYPAIFHISGSNGDLLVFQVVMDRACFL